MTKVLVRTSPAITKASTFLLKCGVLARIFAFRRQVKERIDDGTVELWGLQLGIDEDGCVCSHSDCSLKDDLWQDDRSVRCSKMKVVAQQVAVSPPARVKPVLS